MKVKVYFAGSIRGGRADAELYSRIISHIKKTDLVLTEHIGDKALAVKVYGVVTIDFLLNGGDGYHLAKNALSQTVIDKYIIDIVLPCVKKLTAERKPLAYQADGRVRIVE